jgi:mono/diheme cytochrome c family protein
MKINAAASPIALNPTSINMKDAAMRLWTTAFIMLMMAGTAHTQELKGDPAAGKVAANNLCAQCHDTTGNAKPRSPPGNAPAFIVLAQSPSQTPEKMRRYLNLPHGRMVNVLVTGRDADNVISYILSMRPQ